MIVARKKICFVLDREYIAYERKLFFKKFSLSQ